MTSSTTSSPPQRSALVRGAALFGPAAVLMVGVKLVEYSTLRRHSLPDFGELLWWNGPLLLLAALVAGIGVGVVRHRWPRTPTALQSALGVGLLVGSIVGARVLLPPSVVSYMEWTSPTAFEFVRWDLLILLGTGLAGTGLLSLTRGIWRTLTVLGLHLAAFVLLLVPVLELGYLLATGIPGDWTLIEQAIRHIQAVGPMVAGALGPGLLLLILAPLAVTFLPLLVPRLLVLQHRSRPRTPGLQTTALGLAPLLALLLFVPPTPVQLGHPTSAYASVVRGLTRTSDAARQLRSVQAHRQAAPFDADSLRLAATDSTRRLNVVVILLESVRARSTTPYHADLPTTPFLDSLANEGLLVKKMFAVTPYTNKSLTPLLAGIYPHPGRLVQEAKPGGIPAPGLPDLLRPHGYRSAFFTPATLSFEDKDQVLANLGFDQSFGDGAYPTNGFHEANIFGHEDRIMLRPSLQWADSVHTSGHPFVLSYLTLTSHHDYTTPPDFPTRDYGASDDELNQYHNALRYTDGFLRDLFAGFRQRGLLDETLFIITGDHGEAFGEHRRRTHGNIIWDEALEVPGLLFAPALDLKGRVDQRVDGLRSSIDVVPTVADALNMTLTGGHLPGHSLLKPISPERPLYHHTHLGNSTLALRRDSMKYIYYHERRPMRAFNVERDSLERRDVADRLSKAKRQAVATELLLWRKGVQKAY